MDALPVELLEFIVGCVQAEPDLSPDEESFKCSVASLSAICKTSKCLRSVAEPRLYERLEHLEGGVRARRLLRTLCQRSELAGHVQSLGLIPSPAKSAELPTGEEIEPFTAATSQWKVSDLLTAAQRGCYAAELFLILAMTARLRSFSFDVSSWRRTEESSMMYTFCLCVNTCLDKLFSSQRIAELPAQLMANWKAWFSLACMPWNANPGKEQDCLAMLY